MIVLLGLFISYMTSGCAFVSPGGAHKSEDTPVDSGASSELEDTYVDSGASSELEDTFLASEARNKSECVRIVQFCQAGEYKTAVDIADQLNKAGYRCSEEVLERINFSRSKLDEADAYVLKSKNLKKEGQLLSARANLLKALEIYPKYYWAQHLLKKVEQSINAEITGLEGEARDLRSKGDPERALLPMEESSLLFPFDPTFALGAERPQDAGGKSLSEEKEARKLQEIQSNKDTDNFEETERFLEEDATEKNLGKDGEARLNTIRDYRHSIIRKGFLAAMEAEQKGNLEAAAERTMYVLKLSSAGEPSSLDIVEFTRLLGMKLFSAGNFSKARDLWEEALRLSPGNSKLQKYLAEVEESLDNLKKIKKEASNRVVE